MIHERKAIKKLLNLPDNYYSLIVKKKYDDIEDLFSVDDYLMIYSDTFNESVKASNLNRTAPIVSQIVRHKNVSGFDHGKPADVFLRNYDEYLPKMSKQTINNFERLFETINETNII